VFIVTLRLVSAPVRQLRYELRRPGRFYELCIFVALREPFADHLGDRRSALFGFLFDPSFYFGLTLEADERVPGV
jgi:hypothetical protein